MKYALLYTKIDIHEIYIASDIRLLVNDSLQYLLFTILLSKNIWNNN